MEAPVLLECDCGVSFYTMFPLHDLESTQNCPAHSYQGHRPDQDLCEYLGRPHTIHSPCCHVHCTSCGYGWWLARDRSSYLDQRGTQMPGSISDVDEEENVQSTFPLRSRYPPRRRHRRGAACINCPVIVTMTMGGWARWQLPGFRAAEDAYGPRKTSDESEDEDADGD
jgi:hypothetical protein